MAVCLGPGEAGAQADLLPGAKRPELEPFPEAAPAPEHLELPQIPPLAPPSAGSLAPGLRVFVREIRVEGSSVFSPQELADATAPWRGREIASGELLRARDAVTRLYLEAGYVTSGATVPDQEVEDGVVVIRVIEGGVESIDVTGNERFRSAYFRSRLRRAARAPVNVFELEHQLQLFQRDPLVERVHARLEPGARRGASRLRLEIEEGPAQQLALEGSNYNSPSIGSTTGGVSARVANLVGHGDLWTGEFEGTRGLRQADAAFSTPLPPFDTRLGFHFQYAESGVIEEPFDALDIESETTTYGVTVEQPLLRSRTQEIVAGLVGEVRRSETELLGECFAFVPGTTGCVSRVSVLRPYLEWIHSSPRNAIAARSTLSVGLHAFGSTERRRSLPDSRYLAWLGQLQWAHLLPPTLLGTEVVTRFDVQASDDPLLGIEKFAVGGARTVRGYRENLFVRDNGLVASIELRIPLWRDARRRPVVQLAPFADTGRAWDDGASSDAESLSSVGVGLRVSPFPWLRGELYWGHALDDPPEIGDDLQNDGIHFAVSAAVAF